MKVKQLEIIKIKGILLFIKLLIEQTIQYKTPLLKKIWKKILINF